MVSWVKKKGSVGRFVMEATGVYHEDLAYYLAGNGYEVSIVLPNKISNYFRTLDTKTITDETAAEAITLFGLSRHLDTWTPPKEIYRTLRQIIRERDQILQSRTVAKNQLHAENAGAYPHKSSVKRTQKLIAFLDKQEQEINQEIKELVQNDPEIQKTLMILCTIPGIGLLTASTVLAETNGFDLIRNKRQLVSYAGLDVREKISGTSVKGKPRISKKGNRYLRKAMHFPALAAIRHDERYKAIFARLVARTGIKMKGAVAVQRKLLEMIYVIFKSGKPYDKEYLKKLESSIAAP
jgi:transposase